jgi:hypothetical protein
MLASTELIPLSHTDLANDIGEKLYAVNFAFFPPHTPNSRLKKNGPPGPILSDWISGRGRATIVAGFAAGYYPAPWLVSQESDCSGAELSETGWPAM